MFRKKTVASILSQFSKVVDDLIELETAKHAEADEHNTAMVVARDARNEATTEAKLASEKAKAIRAVFG